VDVVSPPTDPHHPVGVAAIAQPHFEALDGEPQQRWSSPSLERLLAGRSDTPDDLGTAAEWGTYLVRRGHST